MQSFRHDKSGTALVACVVACSRSEALPQDFFEFILIKESFKFIIPYTNQNRDAIKSKGTHIAL
jgi:hypothetical protein